MKYKKYLFFTFIAVIFIDISRYLSWSGYKLNGEFTTYISTFLIYLSAFILVILFLKSHWQKETPSSIQKILFSWFIINIVNVIRGFFLAEGYWDYKFLFLSGISYSIIALLFIVGNNLGSAKIIFKYSFKFLFPLGFLLIPLTFIFNEELYARIMIPITLFILFIPYLNTKYKALIFIVILVSTATALGFRSNFIKILFSLLLLLFYYIKINKFFIQIFNYSLYLIPIILIILALTGTFNVFEGISKDKKYEFEIKKDGNELTNSDTRTFLYVEVLNDINNKGNFLIGSGSTGGYQSKWFYDLGGAMKGKRYNCEVGILNILMRFGLIGVFIYLLLLFKVSYVAINHSSNYLAKMLGLFISFRFFYSFIEEYTQYDLNFYFFWLAIGLVSNNKFRSLNDEQIKKYLFNYDYKYRNTFNLSQP